MVGFMPRAMRVDRLLSEHGIGQDSAAGRPEFERQMERRRLEAIDQEALKPLRRSWYLGSEQFKEQMLELTEGSRFTQPIHFAGCSSRKTVFRSPVENETSVRSVSVPVFTRLCLTLAGMRRAIPAFNGMVRPS